MKLDIQLFEDGEVVEQPVEQQEPSFTAPEDYDQGSPEWSGGIKPSWTTTNTTYDTKKEFNEAYQSYEDFQKLTVGLDPQGLMRVIDQEIKVNIIDKAIHDLDYNEHFTNFVELCKANWKGDARDKFFAKIEEDKKLIKDDMLNEYYSIYNRFNELAKSFEEQDKVLGTKI